MVAVSTLIDRSAIGAPWMPLVVQHKGQLHHSGTSILNEGKKRFTHQHMVQIPPLSLKHISPIPAA